MSRKPGRKIKFADKYQDGYSPNDHSFHRHYNGGGPDFGGNKWGSVLRIAVGIIAAVAVLAAGYFAMSVYMDSRSKPKTTSPGTQPTSQASGASGQTGTTAAPNPQPAAASLQGMMVDTSQLDGGAKLDAVIAQAKQLGVTSVVFDLKRADGTLAYSSTLAAVEKTKAVKNPVSTLETSLKKLKDNQITPVARIYCFKDETAPYVDLNMAILYQDGKQAWHDKSVSQGGKRWLNPYSPQACQYLAEIIQEVSNMGISQILLDGVQYPTVSLRRAYFEQGNLGNPSAEKLTAFIQQAQNAVGSKSTLTVVMTADGTVKAEEKEYYGNILADGTVTSIAPRFTKSALSAAYAVNNQTVTKADMKGLMTAFAAQYKTVNPKVSVIPIVDSKEQAQVASAAGFVNYIIAG